MGNQQAQPSAIGEQSGYKRYYLQMQKQPETDVAPFRNSQITYLKRKFEQLDQKKFKSIEVEDLDQYYELREHPFYERIRILFKQELQKIKVKRVNFQIMLFLLTPFHINSEVEQKYRFLFRLYDWDKDFKLGIKDLVQTFQILFYGPVYDEQGYHFLAEQLIAKHGENGYIKFENFINMVPEDQMIELMTLKFIEL